MSADLKRGSIAAMIWAVLLVPSFVCFTPAAATADETFVAFESGHVRPIALSPDGQLLFAVNTPDNRLEIFRVTPTGLLPRGSVVVGMEPGIELRHTDASLEP